MTAQWLAMAVLLAGCAVVTVFSCVGLAFTKEFFNRMHYLAPVTAISSTLLLIAIVVQDGWSQATIKMILVWFVLLLVNAVLTHATARAARIRERGHWLPGLEEELVRDGEKRQ